MLRRNCFFLILSVCCYQIFSQDIQLGIVTDFEKTPLIDSVLQLMVLEIDKTTGSGKKVTLAPEHIVFGIGSLQDAKAGYNSLSEQTDLIIPIGSVSVKGVLQNGSFPVATIGIGIIDPYIQDIPIIRGKSGVRNFSYIWTTRDFNRELAQFYELYPFENLAILIDASSAITFNEQKARGILDSMSVALSTAFHIVPVSGNITQSLSAIPEVVDAVYITHLFGRAEEDISQISRELKARKLPSFSGSKRHVDLGILGCISDDNGRDQIVRKIGIMIDEAFRGALLSEMPVAINQGEEFYLNIRTAREIGLSPPFKILFTANIVEDEIEDLPTYSLEEIVQRALEANLDIKMSFQDITLSEQDILSARTSMLPALDLSVTGTQINPDRANAALNSPERSLSGQLNFTQLLYSEEAIAGIKITRYLKNAQEHDTEANVLDILLDTYSAYFSILSAKTNLLIQRENFNNSKTNLELAKIRVNLGSASNADLYRWESEVAIAKQAMIEARTALMTTKIQLNTLLANSLEPEFNIEDATLDDELFQQFRQSPFASFTENPRDFQVAMEFMVMETRNNNPNKRYLLENINILEREKLRNQRLFYVPTLAVQAQTSQVLDRGGKGSTETPGVEFIDNTWQLGLSLSYPLFKGAGRRIDLQKSTIQLEQLANARQSLDQNLELAVRANTLQLLNSITNIVFSRISSENSHKNFELIQENYRQGTVTITQLIDAQQAALQAKIGYALSVYEYLQAHLQLEYSMGFFSMFLSPDELNDFTDRYIQFRAENQVTNE